MTFCRQCAAMILFCVAKREKAFCFICLSITFLCGLETGWFEVHEKRRTQSRPEANSMGVNIMKYEDYKRVLDELGIEEAPDDDPFYNEEASIIFLHHTSKQSKEKDTDSTPENLQSDLDTQQEK